MNDSDKNRPRDIQWKRMSFKGNKVWVPCDAQGILVEKNNKVRIKYNLKQDYEYQIKKESLEPEDQARPASPKNKTKKKRPHPEKGLPENCIRIYTDGASSGNPGPSGIGVLLLYKKNRKEGVEGLMMPKDSFNTKALGGWQHDNFYAQRSKKADFCP